ncbi:SDR family NAD(P)-dependent oxidoreductase [Plantactinospora sp. WMMC1484]|uniref:SDR family NAD(P)-dependent oxidoreductase n=1 Tax=Plantactinospora sp. WMMC1484 TaxID=3404122 RepID=UPI003BF5B27D
MTTQSMSVRADAAPADEASPPLAVTAVAGRFPGASDVDQFWALLRDGREGLTRFSDDELVARGVPAALRRRTDYVPVGGLIDGQDLFDPAPFGLTDAEAALMDPQHRLFLETAWQALERSGHGGGVGIEAVGVFAGAAQSAYLASNLAGRWDPTGGGRDPIGSLETAIATQADYLPLQLAYRLGLTGPAMNITTTCSTSLVAVHAAAQSLLAGECDMAIAGGVSLIVPQGHGYRYVPDGIFAVDGRVRPFSAEGTGVVYSQGVGAVVLRRLDEALADGDPVLAVLRGSAVNNDGADKVGFTAPSLRGQARVIAEALAVAGLTPPDVGYLEAHGTGTRLGDPIEVAALRTAFGHADTSTGAWCGLGSVKSNIGHANSAAGIASFIKTVLAIHHRTLPASLHAEPINEQLGLDGSPFAVVTRTRPWDTAPYAGVSSFGIGGTNAHVLLGPAPDRPASPDDDRPQILVYSARDRAALDVTARDLPATDLPDVAYTLQSGRAHLPLRQAVVAGQGITPRRTAPTLPGSSPRVAFLFPGGGSQYAGMAARLYAAEPVFAASIDESAELFRELLGTDVRTLVTGGDDATADSAATGLPALFAVSVATARLLGAWGIRPDVLLGHSLGEYAAGVLSGALTLPDAATLVAVRSRALAGAAGGGAMLSVPLPEADVVALLRDHPGADLAAVNAPDSCVVSGPAEVVDRIAVALAGRGVQPARLPLNSAAHSRLIDPALPQMRAAARSVRPGRPAIATVSSLTGALVGDEFGDPEHWVRQLREPVRFSAALTVALAEPVPTVVVQAGPGAALVAAARNHGLAHLTATVTTFTRDDDLSDLAATRLAAGELWTHGVPVDFPAMHWPGRRRVVAPGYAFQRRRLWIEPSEEAIRPDADAAELLQVPRWQQEPPLPAVTALGGRWLVLGDGADADAIGAALRSAGAEVAEVTGPADVTGPAEGVVVVVGAADTPDETGRLILKHGAVAATIAALDPPPVLLLQVTVHGCRVESGDRPAPATTAARALPRVIAQETPGLSWRTLDVADPRTAGPAVVAELADLRTRRSATDVAVRGGLRWSSAMTPWPVPSAEPAARPGTTALIIGGLGDVGMTIAAHLAARGTRVVITSRSGTRTAGVDQLIARGYDVSVRVLDAGDEDATRALLAELGSGSVLDLVVHAAGVVASGDLQPMRRTDATHVDGHVHAKVRGALALRAAIEALAPADRPSRVVLMSSAGTLVGGIGTGPYSASNGFLNGLAERMATDGTRWVSVVWDAWKVGPLGTEREVNIEYALDAATGMRALDAILSACDAGAVPSVVAVSTTDLRTRMAAADRPAARRSDAVTGELSGVEAVVAEVWSELFGTPITDRDEDFFALGGHSLVATRMLTNLGARYHVRLSLRDLLARPTVAGLAETIATATGAETIAAGTAAEAEPSPIARITDGLAPDGTFAMTRVQHAYWMGRSGGYRFGDTACHFALEYDCPDLDLDRYERAWNRVIARHPMLRAITTGQGRMRQLDQVPHYRIRAVDLTEATEDKREGRLGTLREQVFRRPGPSDRWPLVQVRAARLPGGRVRVFLGIDVLVCDAGSYWIINRDLRHYYEHPDEELPEVPITFAGCVDAIVAQRDTPDWARAADYWRKRLPSLPDAPALPTSTGHTDGRFVRHAGRLDAVEWAAFKRNAADNGVTPTAALLAAYGELLARWSGDQHFAVTLTLFDRPAIHPAVEDVVGDFTSLVLHEVDRRTPASFAAQAQRAHRTLFTDLDHRLFSALDVLAEKSAGTGRVASVPVVFTSALGLDDVIGGDHDLEWAGRQVAALSQTPQTVLDHQVIERDGELLVQWDALEPVLAPPDVDRMFDHYLSRLRALTDPAAWRDEPAGDPPVDEVAVTLRTGTDSGQTLFLVHPSGGDVTCYTDLALRLDERVTVVGLTDPGLAGVEAPTELSRLAGLYVDVLRSIRPHGPYLLGGWSMGGSLGQEMARVLHQRGEHVALLLMLDSNDPVYITAIPGDPDAVEAQVLARHLGALEAYLDIDLGVSTPATLATFLAEPPVHRWARATERLRGRRLLGAREDLRTRLAVFDRHLRGLALHEPGAHLDGRTHTLLIRAERRATRNSGIGMGVDDTPPGLRDLGWSARLATAPEIAGVDADHYSLMREPAIATVAKLINAALVRHLP